MEIESYSNGCIKALYEDEGFEVQFGTYIFFVHREEISKENYNKLHIGSVIDFLEVTEYGDIISIVLNENLSEEIKE